MYKSILSANKDALTSSFSIFIFSISFTCLTALTKTLRNMLTRRGENGHSCLVPYSNKNFLSFSLFTNMLAVCLLYIMSICLNDISPIVSRFSSTSLMKIFRLYQRPFLHLKKWSFSFLSWIYLFSGLHLLIYVCWTFPLSLEWSQLGHGG